jgi:hypothetical protein
LLFGGDRLLHRISPDGLKPKKVAERAAFEIKNDWSALIGQIFRHLPSLASFKVPFSLSLLSLSSFTHIDRN